MEQDPSLGTGRASFPLDDSFVLLASPMDDLYKIVAVNPANSNAMQYALAYLLLAKDFNHVQSFVDTYYGTPAFQIIIIHWRRTMLSDMVSRMSSYPLTNRLIGNTARHMVSNRPHWIGLCSLRKDMNKYDKELLVPCWMVSSIHFGIIYFLLRLDDGNKD